MLGPYYAAATIVLAAATFAAGYKVASNAANAALLKSQQIAETRYHEKELAFNAASAALETAKRAATTRTRTLTREVIKLVDRPIYRADCFDADGLRLANRALTDTDAPDSSQPPPTVPAANGP